jgi:hypothetical protein
MATARVGTGALARPSGAKLRSAFSNGKLSVACEPLDGRSASSGLSGLTLYAASAPI